jgi:hypothetical protein
VILDAIEYQNYGQMSISEDLNFYFFTNLKESDNTISKKKSLKAS